MIGVKKENAFHPVASQACRVFVDGDIILGESLDKSMTNPDSNILRSACRESDPNYAAAPKAFRARPISVHWKGAEDTPEFYLRSLGFILFARDQVET